MPAIDLTNMTYHAEIDRATRFSIINKTVGFGNPVYIASDKKGRDATATLTDTGVLIVRDLTNKIIGQQETIKCPASCGRQSTTTIIQRYGRK